MRRDAEAHAEEDKRRRELAEARNEADSAVWQIEKLLKENGDKLSERDRAPIQSAIDRVKEAAKGDDVQAIRQALSDLQAAAQAMAQHMHRQPGGPPPSGDGHNGQGGAGGKEDVIDAEFEVKK
jgi:molecular chaperone DnaK